MNKRNVATLLWFLSGWSLALMLAAFAGLPAIYAPVMATLLAAVVRWDPTGRLWVAPAELGSRGFSRRSTKVRLSGGLALTQGGAMNLRNLATVLWFLAGWSGGGLLVGLMGLPMILSFVPGILVAVWVRWDPQGVFWSRSATERRIVPADEFAGQLDQNAGPSPAAETDRTSV
jgi:hypothetical protein